MTTLTIQESVKLPKTNFETYEELVDFIIESNSGLEVDKLTEKEKKDFTEMEEFKTFKDTANSISF